MSSTPARFIGNGPGFGFGFGAASAAAMAGSTGFQLIASDGQSLARDPAFPREAEDEEDIPESGAIAASNTQMTMDELLDAAGNLAALPHVVFRLIQMTGDASVTATDLEQVILTDQVIAARVLALANSAYFSLPRKVFFVREAVVFLGFKTVRNLALTVNASGMFLGGSRSLSVTRAQLWHHALDVALTSRLIGEFLHKSDRADLSAEEAFTAGLLHDIGKVALESALPDRFLLAAQLVNERGLHFVDFEDKLFPFGHSAVGGALAQRWNLPAGLTTAIAHHHNPAEAPTNRHIVAVVALANELSGYLGNLIDGHEQIAETAPALYSPACELLEIRPEELPGLILSCQTEIEKGLMLQA